MAKAIVSTLSVADTWV